MEFDTVASALAELFAAEAVAGLALLAIIVAVLVRALLAERHAGGHHLGHHLPR
jgi:hypothetical protein